MFDWIIKIALKNRLTVVALAAMLVVWGGYVVKHLPIDVFPDLNRPTVTILVEGGALAPEEIETLVVNSIEGAMAGLPGVIRVRSSSSGGFGIIWVEFDWGTDLLSSRQLISEKLNSISAGFPDSIAPKIGPISSLMGEIMLVGISGDKDPATLRQIADWTVRPRLQTVPGVAQIIPIGGGVKQISVDVDPVKLRKFGIDFEEVHTAAVNAGANSSGGFVDDVYREFLVRNITRPKTIEEVGLTSVVVKDGVPIKLKDVADVKYGIRPRRGDAGISGGPGVILGVQKQPGVNTIEISEKLEQELLIIQKSMPEGVKLQTLFAQSQFIKMAIHNVVEALRDGSIFVAIVLFLFLLNLRTTVITLTAIPLSLLITFVVLKQFGISINTMTLGGLAVAIGELVDDAIVDVENVFRRLKENKQLLSPRPFLQVIFEASSEVRNSIVMATVIVVLVFLPLFALDGLEGRFFVPLGIAYVTSILASLVVSLTVTPVMCSYFLPKAKAIAHGEDGLIVKKLKAWDKSILDRTLDNPKPVLFSCALLFFVCAASVIFMGREFLPPFNEGTVTAFVATPPGTSLEESSRVGKIAEHQLLTIPGIKVTGRRTGRAEEDEHAEGVYNSEIDVDLAHIEGTRDEVLTAMRSKLGEIPGISTSLGQPISHRLDHMLSGVKAQIAIKIFGDDLATLRVSAEKIRDAISEVDGLVDLEIEKITNVPQLQIVSDPVKTSAYGIQPGQLSEYLEQAMSGGHPASEIFEGQRRVPIVVRFNEKTRSDIEALKVIPVNAGTGAIVPLGQIATIAQTTGPNTINHENGRRRIVVMANTSGRDLGSVAEDVKTALDTVVLPEGYFHVLGGQFENQKTATRNIALLSIISLTGVFFVLLTNFGSSFIALQVMLNIPLALIGSVIAVYLAGGVFSVGTLVGFVTLCGIASRNGIMMISHYLHLMAFENMKFDKDMIIKGSLERLVPVMMTALTAALALIPIVAAGGEPGKEILHPVAVVILGGLVSSTLLDIFVTPAVFYRYGRKSAEKSLARYVEKNKFSALNAGQHAKHAEDKK